MCTSYPYLIQGRLMPESCVKVRLLAYVTSHRPRGDIGTPPERGARARSYWTHGNPGPPRLEDSEITRGDPCLIRNSLDTWQHRIAPDRGLDGTQGSRTDPIWARPPTVTCKVLHLWGHVVPPDLPSPGIWRAYVGPGSLLRGLGPMAEVVGQLWLLDTRCHRASPARQRLGNRPDSR
jgi:hypothetical protein